jgi:dihydroorotase-like cyclic amidohydrolase
MKSNECISYRLNDLVRWLCERPAKQVGLADRKGKISPGLDADFVVWDPDTSYLVNMEGRMKFSLIYRWMSKIFCSKTKLHLIKVFNSKAELKRQ